MADSSTGYRRLVSLKRRGRCFEVVALDDDDGTIEIQYFDGTVEEMDIEDWEDAVEDGALEAARSPRGLERLGRRRAHGRRPRLGASDSLAEDQGLRAGSLDGIDLFE